MPTGPEDRITDDQAMSQLPALAEFRFRLRNFLSFSERQAESRGVTAQQYQMLQVIASSGDQGCSISHLAARLLLRHNSAVELVDRGVRSGLVLRIADATDLRRSMLEITAHGRLLLVELVREHLLYFQQDGAPLVAALEHLNKSSAGQEAS